MTLYDQAVDLLVKLDVAHSSDATDALLARGRAIAQALDDAADTLEQVAAFRSGIGTNALPGVDSKQVAQSVRAFRGGLSTHRAAGMQHQPADSLLTSAKTQSDRATRWAKAAWKELFVEIQPLLDKEASGELVSSGRDRLTARTRAATLRLAQTCDPIHDREDLQRIFGGVEVAFWIEGINARGAELKDSIDALDRERNALTPEVRDALDRAASEAGLPLSGRADRKNSH